MPTRRPAPDLVEELAEELLGPEGASPARRLSTGGTWSWPSRRYFTACLSQCWTALLS